MSERQFAVAVEVWGLESGDLPAAAERVVRCLTDDGASMETDAIQQRATWGEKSVPAGLHELVQDSPGRRLRVLVPFTASEFVDYGFEVLMCAVRICSPLNQSGLALMERLAECGAPAKGCRAKLMWRDEGDERWADASFSRGFMVDVAVDALPGYPAEGD